MGFRIKAKTISKLLVVISLLFFICCCQQKEIGVQTSKIPNTQTLNMECGDSLQINKNHEAKVLAILDTVQRLKRSTVQDSLKIRKLSSLACKANSIKDSALFIRLNKEVLNLSTKTRDTFGLADANWNYGTYYIEKEVYDSAYYYYRNAQLYFKSIDKRYYSAKMLYNMAFIRGRLKDYTGSEILNIEAISILKPLNKPDLLFECYKHLAVIYKELEEFDRALFYNEKALEQLEFVKDKGTNYEGCLNNIGLVYLKQKEYQNAKEYFNKALANKNLKVENVLLYARIIDNRAYCNLKMNQLNGVLDELGESLQIRDSLNNASGIAINKIHLAEFYSTTADTSQAIQYAEQAADISLEINNHRDYMASLKLLSNLDQINAPEYLKKLLYLNDSLQTEERKIRNKFTRIDFETDEYIYDTLRLKQQKIWILAISIGIISILILLYFLLRQYSKNKVLHYETQQQISNEEIYFLYLGQQAKLEEGRMEERNRISEDLHDGILNRLLGTRLNLGFFKFPNGKDEEDKYKMHLNELKAIEKEIRTISHDLKNQLLNSASGYKSLLEKLLKENSKIGAFDFQFKYCEILDQKEIAGSLKINIYRIVQETLQNIVKYSNASLVKLDLNYENGVIYLYVADNGRGFNVNKVREGIGLKNIRSRVKRMNGSLEIKSILDEGTIIQIAIPIS
ncbi:MAG: tetratricopeptide repeat protein [bacterium]|nr:tetratricopeptide repeat protein [bacterium]